MNKSIVFFYPSKVVGGAEYLFMRSAMHLSEVMHYNVKYIDYQDGFVAKLLRNNVNIDVIVFSDYFKTKVLENSIVICPFSSAFLVCNYLKGNFKLLFWSIHPTALYSAIMSNIRFSSYQLADFNTAIKTILDNDSVVFMDGSNLDFQRNKFGFSVIKEQFVPIFCLEKNLSLYEKKVKSPVIHLGWLGRLCIEKVNPIVNVLRHLRRYAEQKKNENFVFHLIGEGNQEKLIRAELLPQNVEIKYLGTLVGDELDCYIVENIDLMFCMGTSALEVASLRKPVILLDFSFEEMDVDNHFRWLFESNRYSVGDEYVVNNNYLHTFNDVMNILKNNELEVIENKCYNYYIDTHTIESVCENLIKRIDSSTLTNSMLAETIFGKFGFIFFLKKINHFRRNLLK